jgi:hypothetical protein
MHGLSIRKIPGVGRVKERLLESIGVKVCRVSSIGCYASLLRGTPSDMWGHLQVSWRAGAVGQTIWFALSSSGVLRSRIQCRPAVGAGGEEKHRLRKVTVVSLHPL